MDSTVCGIGQFFIRYLGDFYLNLRDAFFFKFCSMKANEETYASHILIFFDFWSYQKQTEIASFNIVS